LIGLRSAGSVELRRSFSYFPARDVVGAAAAHRWKNQFLLVSLLGSEQADWTLVQSA
jgi:hypothetical protein